MCGCTRALAILKPISLLPPLGQFFHGKSTIHFRENQISFSGPSGGVDYYFSRGTSGTLIHFQQYTGPGKEGFICTAPYDVPLVYLPPSVVTGQTINGSVKYSCNSNGVQGQVTSTRSAIVRGIVSVTVPFGTFDALRLTEKYTHMFEFAGQMFLTGEEHDVWLAPNIGEVKRTWIARQGNGSPIPGSTRTELVLEYSNLGTDEQSDDGDAETSIADPINYSTGNHFEIETDYTGAGPFPLRLQRFYNSRAAKNRSLGLNWEHTYGASIIFLSDMSPRTALVRRPNGKVHTFKQQTVGWKGPVNVNDELIVNMLGGPPISATYTTAEGNVETYDAEGKLTEVRNMSGLKHNLNYELGMLSSVEDDFGNTLVFEYEGNRVSEVRDQAGLPISYEYDSSGRLVTVTYQDQSKSKYTYNDPSRTSNTDIVQALTSIEDEEGRPKAQWTFDSKGRTTSSQLGGVANKVVVSYNADRTATITDSLMVPRTFTIKKNNGVSKPATLSAFCSTCLFGQIKSHEYDANGNRIKVTDFMGNVSTYVYDLARNLETSRTEGVGTADARTVTTRWHAKYRLPVQIFEPKRVTKYDHDAKGNVLFKTEQSTTDTNGAKGVNAIVTGAARKWAYTYFPSGQIKQITGPRTDIADVSDFTYDNAGNMATYTNAARHTTTYSEYDPHGRVGKITDPNGLEIKLTYWPRGWPKSQSVGGETTTYDYDKSGRLQKITLPDTSFMTYTYDAAGRRKSIIDNIGNSVVYELDAAGNRLEEKVSDPEGVLRRKIVRTYHPNNLLKTVSGSAQ